jgi:hypothetical protein
MQFMVMVLNKVEVLDALLERLMGNGICGATILNSTGMVRELAKSGEDLPIFGTPDFQISSKTQSVATRTRSPNLQRFITTMH